MYKLHIVVSLKSRVQTADGNIFTYQTESYFILSKASFNCNAICSTYVSSDAPTSNGKKFTDLSGIEKKHGIGTWLNNLTWDNTTNGLNLMNTTPTTVSG